MSWPPYFWAGSCHFPLDWRLGGPQNQNRHLEEENNVLNLPGMKPAQSLVTVLISLSYPGSKHSLHKAINWLFCVSHKALCTFNHLTPNDHFGGRTAQLTSRCCIFLFVQQIYVVNILNMLHTLCFFLFKMPFISWCYLFWFVYYSHFIYKVC